MSTKHRKCIGGCVYPVVVLILLLTMFPLVAFGQTVSSVIPKDIRLEPGGKEVSVNITGTGLDKITSVQVVMNNQPVKEIQAVLGAPALKGRQVTLRASSQAAIGSNYQLRVMIGTVPINLPTQIVQVQVVKAVVKAEPVGEDRKTPIKVIKHGPRPIKQAEVDRHRQLVKTKKLTPIPYKAFTYQDFKDPKTGVPIKPDEMITLKIKDERGKQKRISGQEFLNEVNKLEQQFNTFGYTFRKPRKTMISAQGVPTQPPVLEESVINTKLMQDQRVKAAPAFKKVDPSKIKVNPYKISSFQAVTPVAPGKISHQAVPQNLQQIVGAIKPYHNVKSYDQDWGDRNWFAVGIHAKMQLDADQNKMRAYAEGRATGTVYNQDWDIVKVTGLAEAPTQTAGQKMHAKLVANVCGEDFFTYEDSKDGSLLIGEDRSIGVDESVSFHFVIVVIPVEARLGFRGSAGIEYGIDLAPLKAKALFSPHVNTTAYAQIAVDLKVVKGGVGGKLTLLDAALPIGATVGVETSPTPILFAEYYIQHKITVLSGSIYAFVEVDLLFWSDSWSWDIFKWEGFGPYDGYLVIPQRDEIAIDVGQPPAGGVVIPSTKYQLIVNKPGKGTGKVTSSPPGIDCGSDCYEFYTAGQTVTLTATAGSDSDFEGWEGACSGTGPCTVTMNASTTVTATFIGKDAYNVQLFEHTNHGGGSYTYTLVPGQCLVLAPDFTKTGWNDKFSSVKVGSKVEAVLFEHTNYCGAQLPVTGDMEKMPEGWNDKASSVIVFLRGSGMPGVLLKGNRRIFLPIGKNCDNVAYWSLKDFGDVYNDDATNLYVWPNLRVTLYQDAGYKGKSQTFTGAGQFDITDTNVKGKVSSVLIELTEEIPKRK